MSLYKEHMFCNKRGDIFQSSEQSLVSCREKQLDIFFKKQTKNCEWQEEFVPATVHKTVYL